jgi:hypothetical protein
MRKWVTEKEMRFMIQEITMGMSKEETKTITDKVSSDTWDRLVTEISGIKEEGFIVDIVFDTPEVDVVEKDLIVP